MEARRPHLPYYHYLEQLKDVAKGLLVPHDKVNVSPKNDAPSQENATKEREQSECEIHCRRNRQGSAIEVLLPETQLTQSMVQSQPLQLIQSFHLRLLRLRNVSRRGTLGGCRVYVDEQFVGESQSHQDKHHEGAQDFFFDGIPIELEGTLDSIIRFEILGKKGCTELMACGPLERIFVSDSDQNPNIWLELPPMTLTSSVSSSLDSYSCGNENNNREPMQLLVRLVEASPWTPPPARELPSTRNLQPGPNLAPMDSYAVRKAVLQSTAPVTLHVYDVSNSDRVADMNYFIKALGLGGIFHAAVEIHGREYSFGGSSRNVSGIFTSLPKRCPLHHYRESIYLGDCELTPTQVKAILQDTEPQWMAPTYDLFTKNCCFFSRDFSIQLGMGNIPKWVYVLAETAEPLQRYIKTASAERKRAKAHHPQQQQPQHHYHREALQCLDSNRDMIDHAMAARVQRSYRRKISKRKLV